MNLVIQQRQPGQSPAYVLYEYPASPGTGSILTAAGQRLITRAQSNSLDITRENLFCTRRLDLWRRLVRGFRTAGNGVLIAKELGRWDIHSRELPGWTPGCFGSSILPLWLRCLPNPRYLLEVPRSGCSR